MALTAALLATASARGALPDVAFLMVPENSPAHAPADLKHRAICFMVGSAAQQALEMTFARLRLDFSHLAFRRTDAMGDAYGDGRCQAVAADMATLAAIRAAPGVTDQRSRLLAPLDAPMR